MSGSVQVWWWGLGGQSLYLLGSGFPARTPACPGPVSPALCPGCTHHLGSLWANPPGRGEIALPATSSSSFPLPVVTVTLAVLGVRLRLGGINFVRVSIFPDAGQPKGLSLLVLFQGRPRGWEVLGCGGVDKEPLPPASQEGWVWVREKLRGGGEGERAASPRPVPMAVGAGLRPGSGSSAPRACWECTERGCLFSWPGALWAETLFQASGCQIHPHWLEK